MFQTEFAEKIGTHFMFKFFPPKKCRLRGHHHHHVHEGLGVFPVP